MDWGLFHVEPAFLGLWRRYARALKQRNSLLKMRHRAGELDAWEVELAASGTALTSHREHYLAQLQPWLAEATTDLLPEAGATALQFLPGWRREDLSLADALLLARERDLATGFTSVGPHRADWRVEYARLPGREALSRGQEKLTALACVLAQARAFAADRGEWPLVCLDDLASELDQAHLRQALAAVLESGAQVLLTATEAPAILEGALAPMAVFHVERGVVTRA